MRTGKGLGLLTLGLAVSVGAPMSADAASTLYDTSAASITCTSITKATVKLTPPLTTLSTGNAAVKVKVSLTGCTATGALPALPALQILSGKISGTINTAGAGGCGGLLLPSVITGNLVAKWKAASGQALDFKSTTVSNGMVTGGLFIGPTGAAYGVFNLSGQTILPGSAFAGGVPSASITTAEDAAYIAAQCAAAPPGKGMGKINLGIGGVTL